MAAIPKIEVRNEPGKPFKPLQPANDNKPNGYPGIISSADLVRGFLPPDYLLDGVAQKSFIYSMTAASGTGKTAVLLLLSALTAMGRPLDGRDVHKGRVVYFAGENPDDVAMRWIAMAHHLPFNVEAMDVHFIKGTFSIPSMLERIKADVKALGGATLIVVDTSAAYFQGQDENGNTELGKHARELRELTTLEGRPCVMVACHPTKNATTENLLPRGGGAFIAEMDGNLVCMKTADGSVKLHWQGKHRGPDFAPVMFELDTVTAPDLKDSRGRDVPTVMARPISSGEVRKKAATARRDEDDVLLEIDRDGGQSLSAIADRLGWEKDDAPHKDRVRHATDKLKRDKLATYSGRKWKLTAAGSDAVADVRAKRFDEQRTAETISKLTSKNVVRNV